MAVTPFDEEAVRRILDATASVAGGPDVILGQIHELNEWIAYDQTEVGENLQNLLGAFLTVTSRLAAMTAGAQIAAGRQSDVGAVLREVDGFIAQSRDKWERRN